MTALRILHRTTYNYSQPVSFGPHRMLLRPRESRDLKLISNTVTLNVASTVTWSQDVFGNSVASASFHAMSSSLVVESVSELELYAAHWPVFDIAASAISYPFSYSDDEWTDLGALTVQQYADPEGRLRDWTRGFVHGPSTDTLSLLKDLSNGVTLYVGYQSREVEGTQTPTETLDRRLGSCRDMAVLFIEAVRGLGFGARIVSGYLHNPDLNLQGISDAGCTHAWAEVFLPGAGWVTFDPTNRSVGGSNLIPIAVGRGIHQVTPVAGDFVGPVAASMGLWVEVTVAS